jgi:hypothetical protein
LLHFTVPAHTLLISDYFKPLSLTYSLQLFVQNKKLTLYLTNFLFNQFRSLQFLRANSLPIFTFLDFSRHKASGDACRQMANIRDPPGCALKCRLSIVVFVHAQYAL